MKVKVVKTGESFELVSWEKRDLVHYGIRDKATGNIIETFEPNKKLKGWQMRKQVEATLDKYEAEGIPEERKYKISITKSVDEIRVGHVLVYHNVIKDELVYCKVTKLNHLFVYFDYGNRDHGFQHDLERLQERIDKDEIWVIRLEDVPEDVTFG
jgi:hypothetical protein